MNAKYFDTIKQASAGFVAAVDSMIPDYQREANADRQYNADLQQQRRADRNTNTRRAVEAAAAAAKSAADAAISEMKGDFDAYMMKSHPALPTLQAMLSAGVQLTEQEIKTFAQTQNFAILRLLEKPSRGHIVAPDRARFDNDMQELTSLFNSLAGYCGPNAELLDTIPARNGGLSPRVYATVIKAQLANLPAKLAEISERWGGVDNAEQ